MLSGDSFEEPTTTAEIRKTISSCTDLKRLRDLGNNLCNYIDQMEAKPKCSVTDFLNPTDFLDSIRQILKKVNSFSNYLKTHYTLQAEVDSLKENIKTLQEKSLKEQDEKEQLLKDKLELTKRILEFTTDKTTTGLANDRFSKREIVDKFNTFIHKSFMRFFGAYKTSQSSKGDMIQERAIVLHIISKNIFNNTMLISEEIAHSVITNKVINDFMKIDRIIHSNQTKEKLNQLILEGLQLAKEIAKSDQPIELCFVSRGTPYDSTSHNSQTLSTGFVQFTAFPGLRIGPDLQVLPLVFLSRTEDDMHTNTTQLIAMIIAIISPFTPILTGFLSSTGENLEKWIVEKGGPKSWDLAKKIWEKLKSKVDSNQEFQDASRMVAHKPDNKNRQTELAQILFEILKNDTAFLEELSQLVNDQNDTLQKIFATKDSIINQISQEISGTGSQSIIASDHSRVENVTQKIN